MSVNAIRKKVKCPFCGYEMNIVYDPGIALCRGVFAKCKGRKCGKEFEIKIGEIDK